MPRACARRFARPYQYVHPERLSITRDGLADATVSEDSEREPAQRAADASLPDACFQRGRLLRNFSHRREHESPGQFRCRIGRRSGVHIRRDDDSEARTRLDIYMRVDAALADEPEFREALQQIGRDLRALANQHKSFGVLEPLPKDGNVIDVIVPDLDFVAVELSKTGESAEGIEVVVEDRDLQATRSGRDFLRRSSPAGVRLTIERSSWRSIAMSPRSFASSHTGSRGQEVRHASIVSS